MLDFVNLIYETSKKNMLQNEDKYKLDDDIFPFLKIDVSEEVSKQHIFNENASSIYKNNIEVINVINKSNFDTANIEKKAINILKHKGHLKASSISKFILNTKCELKFDEHTDTIYSIDESIRKACYILEIKKDISEMKRQALKENIVFLSTRRFIQFQEYVMDIRKYAAEFFLRGDFHKFHVNKSVKIDFWSDNYLDIKDYVPRYDEIDINNLHSLVSKNKKDINNYLLEEKDIVDNLLKHDEIDKELIDCNYNKSKMIKSKSLLDKSKNMNDIKRGIIWSEILGKPKCKK